MAIDHAEFEQRYRRAKHQNQAQILIETLPYARFLGMEVNPKPGSNTEGQSAWHFCLPPKKHNVGNPTLPALHGGAIAGFMEMSSVLFLMMSMDVEEITGHEPRVPKIVDFSIDYIRACRLEPTYARCETLRRGRRLTNIGVRIWQHDPAAYCATARVHYLVD